MEKSYKDYCREAVQRDPNTYGKMFNLDGSVKPTPSLASMYNKRKITSDIPAHELNKLRKTGWHAQPTKSPELMVTGTEIKLKGRKLNLTILKMPDSADRKEYNRIWMHNDRVRQRLKKLKEKYGVTATL